MLKKVIDYLIEGVFFAKLNKKFFSIIKKLSLKNISKYMKSIRNSIDVNIGLFLRRLLYSNKTIVPNKLFVMTYDDDYSCNPKYIVEELIKRKLNIDIVWATNGKNAVSSFPKSIRTTIRGKREMFMEQATSKVWLDNALNCVWYGIPKNKEQLYINTWHGSLGIKKLTGNKFWMSRAKLCNDLTDYCITNSAFEEDVFRDTFWKDVKYAKYGHARNDLLLNEELIEKAKHNVRHYYRISKDKRLLLYAPTFKTYNDNSYKDFNYSVLRDVLGERFGGEWVILLRLHFKDRKKLNRMFFKENGIIDAGSYPDMQELIASIDCGITDYSSWAYDYILTKKPLFVFAPDLDKYSDNRGFYYPIQTTPFPIANNERDLFDNIEIFNNDEYLEKVDLFLKDKGCYETGEAAKLAADLIENILLEEDNEK